MSRFPFPLTAEQVKELLAVAPTSTMSQLVARFGASATCIWRLLKRNGVRSGGSPAPITPQEKRLIRLRTEQGKTQLEIAAELQRSKAFVGTWQKKLKAHCRGRRPVDAQAEQEVVLLLQQGLGQIRVAKVTRVGQPQVHAIMQAHNIRHKTGGQRIELPPEKYVQFVQAVFSGRYYCKDLQERFHLSNTVTRRLAKEILGVPQFLRGARQRPLDSDFPQKHFDVSELIRKAPLSETFWLLLVSGHVLTHYLGTMPADTDAFVASMLSECLPPGEHPAEIRDAVAASISQAVKSYKAGMRVVVPTAKPTPSENWVN